LLFWVKLVTQPASAATRQHTMMGQKYFKGGGGGEKGCWGKK